MASTLPRSSSETQIDTPQGRWAPTLGAMPRSGGCEFRVWAPDVGSVDVVFPHNGDQWTVTRALAPTAHGYFEGWVPDVRPGTRYKYRLDQREPLVPDPASRFQPEGVHGPSAFVDPGEFVWTDQQWAGLELSDAIIYELHVGAFTPEGTFQGVESRLEHLKNLGVTAIELMPIAEFAGTRNWGYDGVDVFAPSHHYGSPDDLR